MSEIVKDIEAIRSQFLSDLEILKTSQELEELRIAYLGKKGRLTSVLKGMGKLSKEERPTVGKLANEVRELLNERLDDAKRTLRAKELEQQLESEKLDVTVPGIRPARGVSHPIEQTIDLICRVFIGMGYTIAEGPEVEFVANNFDRLNIPASHPSRDERDTFYITDRVCLRTQTSPVQIRVLEKQKPPIRIVCPGKVYRPDTPDATHSPIFHQIEGLVVDRGISMSDLVGTLKLFARELFGEHTEIRLRPHHFPFTEPSCEVDVTCWKCGGEGCSTCKGEGFVEVLGAGMVHPKVLSGT
ncbi:MAG TPA: phenylalanine--tRNA ligase subunit alpha, partial [Clostridiaceae bacterium]|nr:phenylalanine--tRNA ligase subunit alpha [Clostridiaceae bacterium]